MKTIIIFLVIFISRTISINAQWTPTYLNYNGWIKCLFVNDTAIFIGTNSEGIIKSYDSGISWTNNNPGLSDTLINSILAIGSNMYASSNNKIFFSSDNGLNWDTLVTNIFGNINSVLGLNLGFNNDTLFCSSESGIYKSYDFGISWQHIYNFPTGVKYYSFSNNKILGSGLGIGISLDQGTTWNPIWNSSTYSGPAILVGNKILGSTGGSLLFLNNYDEPLDSLSFHSFFNNKTVYSLLKHNNSVFAAGNFGVSLSVDSGYNWIDFNSGFPYGTVISNLSNNNQFLYAYSPTNGLWKRQISDVQNSLYSFSGKVFNDLNNNGNLESNEVGMANIIIEGMSSYFSTDTNGFYSGLSDIGQQINIVNPFIYSSVTPNYYIISQADTGKNFGIHFFPNVKDLRLSLTNITPARPGFNDVINISFNNQGTTVMSGSVKLITPNNINFLNSNPSQDYIIGDTIIWNFSNLTMLESRQINVVFNLPTTTQLGSNLQYIACVNPIVNDTTPLNNIDTLHQIVVGSYDPNQKVVDPSDIISPVQIANNEKLIYTIHFQNTGTDTAFNIIIVDTLSSNLYIPSLEVIAASHTYTYTIRGHGIVEFNFANIFLPESNTNELLSNGFVKYSIKPKSTLVLNDQINNTASIYFDYNVPISTNKATIIVQYPAFMDLTRVDDKSISIYPNPANKILTIEPRNYAIIQKIEILNILGDVLFTSKINISTKIDISDYSNGVYFIKVKTDQSNIVNKFVKE